VYIDLTFYKLLADQLGAPGEFAQPYVLAHEYGHHIQDLVGTEAKMRQAQQGASNAEQNLLSVKLELQADCYAGVWAKGASDTKASNGQQIFKSLTAEDIQQGIDTAGKIGDDTLQQRSGQSINPAEFTHGTSADRQKWFSRGYNGGDPRNCDTFASGAVNEGD
jgi:predicted metalloprotease